jgi:fructoselysine-6-P-deglycase FrlB-like protein
MSISTTQQVQNQINRAERLLKAVEAVIPEVIQTVERLAPAIEHVVTSAVPAVDAVAPVIANAFRAEAGKPLPTLLDALKRLILPSPPQPPNPPLSPP